MCIRRPERVAFLLVRPARRTHLEVKVLYSRRSAEATYLLAVRCPVYRGRDSSLGFRTELENLVCDGKGKGASGNPARPKVQMRKPGADCSIGALIRGNSRGAKGAGYPY